MLNEKDLWLLKQIYKVFREVESQARDGDFPELELNKLIILLGECTFSEDENVKRLTEIRDHLYPCMTVKHFLNFMVPIERLLDRSLKDDDFVVTSADQTQKNIERRPLYFVLDNLRSAFNVGSIFRLADGIGASKLYLCGYTATPEQDQIKKTAMQTDNFVQWEHQQKTADALKTLREQGVYIIALETAAKSLALDKAPMKGPTAFLVGNERFGLDRELLTLVDEVRHIPMFGIKNSLNVANSLSIAAFEWSRQN